MKSNSFLVFLSTLCFSTLLFPQQKEEIEKRAETILLSLANNNIFPEKDFIELKDFVFYDTITEDLETKYLFASSSFDSLKIHLLKFEKEMIGVSTDSALTLFVNWYLNLQRTFYNYNKENFFNSQKTKILFISTSVSCHCTLEMCKKQLIEILKLKEETNGTYLFFMVDSYWNNDLQLKYETYFAPSLIVFDENNNMLLNIEYDENMIDKLKSFL